MTQPSYSPVEWQYCSTFTFCAFFLFCTIAAIAILLDVTSITGDVDGLSHLAGLQNSIDRCSRNPFGN